MPSALQAPLSRLFLLSFCASACNEQSVGTFNTAPSATIIAPVSGEVFDEGVLVEFVALVQDSQDDPAALEVSWSSNLDGGLGTDPADSSGDLYLATNALQAGSQVVSLTVIDSTGDSTTTAVDFYVGEGPPVTGTAGGEPTVILAGPSPNDTFTEGSEITFVGTVTDDEQDWGTLSASLSSSRDGEFWVGAPTEDGRIDVDWSALQVGTHTITLWARDDDDNTASDAVDIEVLDDGRPTVLITSPSDGAVLFIGETTVLEGEASDTETDTEELIYTWTSDLWGELASGHPDSSGAVTAISTLQPGAQVITLSVEDTDAQSASDSIAVSVYDPDDYDDDGDGYSENEGDCDDDDPAANPGEAEICDDIDNNCDGNINEDWWDSYEENDTIELGEDLGEVDESLGWANSQIGLSGLTIHSETDEDWILWYADDEYWDDVSVYVTVNGLPSAGLYVVELYLEVSGSWVLQDDATGHTSITLFEEGSLTNDDEDYWALRIYPVNWPADSCASSYSIDIES